MMVLRLQPRALRNSDIDRFIAASEVWVLCHTFSVNCWRVMICCGQARKNASNLKIRGSSLNSRPSRMMKPFSSSMKIMFACLPQGLSAKASTKLSMSPRLYWLLFYSSVSHQFNQVHSIISRSKDGSNILLSSSKKICAASKARCWYNTGSQQTTALLFEKITSSNIT